jgi:hypothetical protein
MGDLSDTPWLFLTLLDPASEIKTLDLVADQSSAANSTYALIFQKSKNNKGKNSGQLCRQAANNQTWYLGPSIFFLNDSDGDTSKVR